MPHTKLEKSIGASNAIVSLSLQMNRPGGVKFITKLGTAKGVERSRIWIDGLAQVEVTYKIGVISIMAPDRWTK